MFSSRVPLFGGQIVLKIKNKFIEYHNCVSCKKLKKNSQSNCRKNLFNELFIFIQYYHIMNGYCRFLIFCQVYCAKSICTNIEENIYFTIAFSNRERWENNLTIRHIYFSFILNTTSANYLSLILYLSAIIFRFLNEW